MAERVLVAGASGYLGRRLVPRLRARGRIVRALVRGGAAVARRHPHLEGCEIADGDVLDPASCARAMEGVDAVVHLVGIIRETGRATFESIHVGGTVALVQAARASRVAAFLYVSALGARADSPSAYARTKAQAEELVRTSGLTWLVLRPSIVLASDGEFLPILRRLTAFPVVPVLGTGRAKLQPVLADDLAEMEANAFDRPGAWNRAYSVCGPVAYAFNDLLRKTARGPRWLVHVPLALARPAVALAARLLPAPPITPDQLAMLEEGSVCPDDAAARAFGVTLRPVDPVFAGAAA